MTPKRILDALLVVLCGVSLAAAQSKTGTTIGQVLLIEPSARIAGMGNAGVTNYDEVEAVYFNPGAVGYLSGYNVQFTHTAWIADITYDYAALEIPLGDFGNTMLTVTDLNSGDIDVTTVQQEHGNGQRYSVNDIAIGVGYGRQISERFSVGVEAYYLQETIWHSSLSAFGLNVGTIYRLSPDGFHIGASVSNFGTQGRYDGTDLRILYDQNPTQHGQNPALPGALVTDQYPLPVLFRVGVGMPVKINDDNILRVEVDAFHPSDNLESVNMGAEWAFERTLFVRGGYQELGNPDRVVGLTLGAGVRYAMQDFVVTFDYGWADEGRLTQSHRFTLGVSF